MPVTIHRKYSLNHTVKFAIATVAVFAVVGALAKLKRGTESTVSSEPTHIVLSPSSPLLVPTIRLPVAVTAAEVEWTAALAKAIQGNAEVKVAYGRVDVMTDQYAIEVDFLTKWKEGLGQAIHYADVSERTPVLAIVMTEPRDETLLRQIERLTASKGVRLVLLTPTTSDDQEDVGNAAK